MILWLKTYSSPFGKRNLTFPAYKSVHHNVSPETLLVVVKKSTSAWKSEQVLCRSANVYFREEAATVGRKSWKTFFTDIPQDLLKLERTVDDIRNTYIYTTITILKRVQRELYIFTCSNVSCLEMVSFSSFLIFFISLLTWNSCSCSRCCSSSAFSCCNWKMKKHRCGKQDTQKPWEQRLR